MKTVNIYEAKTQFSKLIELVQNGEEVVIAKAGKPVANIVPYVPGKNIIKFGTMANQIRFNQKEFNSADPEILNMFYGSENNK